MINILKKNVDQNKLIIISKLSKFLEISKNINNEVNTIKMMW